MKHIKTPITAVQHASLSAVLNIMDADGFRVAACTQPDRASELIHAVNTIEALEKSHAELLAALEEAHKGHFRTYLVERAIANAQPVVTMLREGRG